MGYQSLGMIGTNGGYEINGRDNIPYLVTKGKYEKNDKYNINYPYSTLAISSNGYLSENHVTSASSAKSWLEGIGARNAWSTTLFTTGNKFGNSSADQRTTICQIDKHNFILRVGYHLDFFELHRYMHNTLGCSAVANLDGGGSTAMYYKTGSMSSTSKIYKYTRPDDPNRQIVDILYFVE